MRLLCLLLLFIGLIDACPEVVANICQCYEVHNGVILDCSNSTGHETMQLIRNNQALLGLIQSLTMNRAGLSELPPNFFAGLYIKKLDLSYNQIKTADAKTFDGMNPVLEELIMNHNLFEQVPSSALSSLPNLLRLDLSNNSITEISETTIFPTLNKLYDINLGSNDIFSIHTSSFQNVKSSIQTINLGHNNLSTVPSSAIRGLKQLQSLHLHQNHIEQLDALSFLNLPVLNLLNLAGNQILELNRQAFLNVPNLRYLYLSGNKIKKLTSHQFQTFEQLEMLDLTNNQIGSVPDFCISGLKQLRQLYLGDNKISNISSNAFTNSSIVVLVLSGNNMKTLPNGTISGLPNLQQLSFRSNQIESIDRNAFYDVTSMVMLDLAKNKLTDIAPSTFLAQLNLLFVDLSENKLTKTPYSAFNRRVGTVLLKENPLVCTENIHMLQDGSGVFIKNSVDKVCGRKPVPVPEEPQVPENLPEEPKKTPALVQMPRLQIHRNQAPSGVFQQAGLVKHTIPNRGHSRFILEKQTAPIDQSSEQTPQNTPVILPTREDELSAENTPTSTPSLVPTTTDIIDRPNIVLPFPVPFLKKGPSLSESKKVQIDGNLSTTTPVTHTLPPSILIEPGSTPKSSQQTTEARVKSEHIDEFALTAPENKETSLSTSNNKSFYTTAVVVICVGTALIVLIVVVVGLCINKHRQLRFENAYSDSSAASAARTSEYISSQYRQTQSGARGVGRFEESPAWIYNPGSSYCNYYK